MPRKQPSLAESYSFRTIFIFPSTAENHGNRNKATTAPEASEPQLISMGDAVFLKLALNTTSYFLLCAVMQSAVRCR